MDIQHREYQNGGEFVVEVDDERLAEMTYRRVGDVLFIDHTEVDDRMRGQGVARSLLDRAVAYARDHAEKIVPLCPYARAQFERDPSLADVLKALPPKIER